MPDQQHIDFEKKFHQSEEKFQTVFRLTTTACKIIDSNLNIIKVNKALSELLGFSAEELIGTQILDYACPEYITHWHELQDALWSKQTPFFKLEVCLIKKDKTLIWVSVTTVLFNENDETFGLTVLDDITYKKQYKESEKRLNLALQFSKMAVWEMNLADYTVIRSESHDEIFGYKMPLAKWDRHSYRKQIVHQDIPIFNDAIDSIGDNGLMDTSVRITTFQGQEKWIHFQGRLEKDENGKARNILGTIKDVSKHKLNEKYRDQFINIISHELRTPITSIKAQTQLLEKKFTKLADENKSIMLTKINAQVDKLNILIKDLLEVSRTDQKTLPLKKANFSFDQMILDTLTEIQGTTSTHELILLENPAISFYGDRERISQVFSNLLRNAIKFSVGKDKVLVSVENKSGHIITTVTDFGIGITAAHQPHIFKRFYKVDQENLYDTSGFGLGLYLSAELINQMNGEIWVTSEHQNGATFHFSLPNSQ